MAENSDRNPLRTLGRIFKKTANSDAGKIIGSVLRETPIGKAGRIFKEVVDIFGGNEEEEALLEAMKNATPEQITKLEEIRTNLRIEEVKAKVDLEQQITAREQEVTARHAADMLSDSKLSKAIRPSICIGLNGTAALYSWAILHLVGLKILLAVCWDYSVEIGEWEQDLIGGALGYMWAAAGGYNVFYAGFRSIEKGQSMKSTADIFGR